MLGRFLKTKKSGGVRVTAAVHRLVQRGDAARGERRWSEAADAYRAALAAAPELHHVGVQLGHALKEAGRLDEADTAYADASGYAPGDLAILLHRADLARRRGRLREAARLLVAVLDRDPRHGNAARELDGLGEAIGPLTSGEIRSLLAEAPVAADAAGAGIVFDVTDLVGHFRYQRLPTGIQRVQIEVVAAALAEHGPDRVAICACVRGRSGWTGIATGEFERLARLAGAGSDMGDPAWRTVRARLLFGLATGDAFMMPPGATLINIGTSLWVADYFRMVRNAKAQAGIRYVPFVHDVIPVVHPEFCAPGLAAEFAGWIAGLFQHADGFVTSARSTKRDLQDVATRLGHDVPDARIAVVPLDADFAGGTSDSLPANALARWALEGARFALLVSTIEPRKNHLLAFDAWAELIASHGAAVPRLVCVGRDGWMNDAVFARLAANPALMAAVTIIHHASDAELALLYRTCLFTLYPSFYEGWGLPVTEALSHGRVPVVADNSSLPEAGGGFALLFEDGSVPALVRAVERVAFDDAWRAGREATIAAERRPRSWREIAAEIVAAADRFRAEASTAIEQTVDAKRYYPVALHQSPALWPGLVNGEIFRAGDGWIWPEPDGCRIAPGGGELRFRIAAGRTLRLHLLVRGLAATDCPITLGVGEERTETIAAAGEELWLTCAVSDAAGPSLSVAIVGAADEEVRLRVGGVEQIVRASVKVLGFLLTAPADEAYAADAMAKISGWRQAAA